MARTGESLIFAPLMKEYPMKTKTIILLSVCALVVLFQGIGAGYAYHSLKEKADVSLKAAFRKAFDTLVDEQGI